MKTLQDAIINSFGEGFDKQAEQFLNSNFLNNRQSWVNSVVNDFMKYNINPNESISKIAKTHSLNDEQIQRIIEETNVNIYLQKYAQTKGKSLRRVSFTLADPAIIKNSSTNVTEKVATEADKNTRKENVKMMEKAASNSSPIKPIDFSPKEDEFGNFLTRESSYEPSLWDKGNIEKNASILVKRKIEQKISNAKVSRKKQLNNTLQKIAFIGDALIYHERAGCSAQDLLDKIAVDTDLNRYEEFPIIKYTINKVAKLKNERFLPGNFYLSLDYTKDKSDDYSLGKHSLSKKANVNDVYIDVRHLPSGTDYEKLVSLARELKRDLEENKLKSTSNIKIEGV